MCVREKPERTCWPTQYSSSGNCKSDLKVPTCTWKSGQDQSRVHLLWAHAEPPLGLGETLCSVCVAHSSVGGTQLMQSLQSISMIVLLVLMSVSPT